MKLQVNRRENGNNERTDSDKQQRIQERAHQLYLDRGQSEGQELEDWLQAEREINAESKRQRVA